MFRTPSTLPDESATHHTSGDSNLSKPVHSVNKDTSPKESTKSESVDGISPPADHSVPSIDTYSTHAETVDVDLTRTKLARLRSDVERLETAIRHNEASQKDLHDWLFDQMSALSFGPLGSPTDAMSSSESGVKRVFGERLKVLKQQNRALNEQANVTRYVVEQLEQHGIPVGVDPKEYVRNLIKQRGKGGTPATKPTGAPPTINTTAPTELKSKPSAPQTSKFFPHRPVSNTMPATCNPSSRLQPHKVELGRYAHTLPSTSTSVTMHAHEPSRLSVEKFTEGRSEQPSVSVESAKQESTTAHLSVHLPDPRLYDDPLFDLLAPAPIPTITTTHSDAPDTLAPDAGQDSRLRKMSTGLTIAKSQSANRGVLRSVRDSLSHFGRHRRQTHQPRSVSEENLSGDNHGGGADSATHSPHKDEASTSSKTSRLSVIPFMRRRKSKSHILPASEYAASLLPPETLGSTRENSRSHVNKSHSGSLSSYNEISSTPSHFRSPQAHTTRTPGHSISGFSGVNTPLKEGQVQSNGSTSLASVDITLSKILGLLTLDISPPAPAGGVGRGSSSSSISASAGPTTGSVGGPRGSGTGLAAATDSQLHPSACSTNPVSTRNVALTMMAFYRLWNTQITSLACQQNDCLQALSTELQSMRRENLQLHETMVKLMAELDSMNRDAHTREELNRQQMSDATARIDQLDATAEELRQTTQRDRVQLQVEIRGAIENWEYQLKSQTRNLSDSISTLSNKVSIIEKPSEHETSRFTSGSDLMRIRNKVLHYLIDMFISLFALLTTLLQVLIRCLNLGAAVTENRILAICFSVVIVIGILIAYNSEFMISHLYGDSVANLTTIPRTGVWWRDAFIKFLSVFRKLSREDS